MYKSIAILSLLLMAPLSHVFAQGSTDIGGIDADGEPNSYLIESDSIKRVNYSSPLRDRLVDSGIHFVLVLNRPDGKADSLVVFSAGNIETICSWDDVDLSGITLVFGGKDRLCSE